MTCRAGGKVTEGAEFVDDVFRAGVKIGLVLGAGYRGVVEWDGVRWRVRVKGAKS